jgi:hypothetical protein
MNLFAGPLLWLSLVGSFQKLKEVSEAKVIYIIKNLGWWGAPGTSEKYAMKSKKEI